MGTLLAYSGWPILESYATARPTQAGPNQLTGRSTMPSPAISCARASAGARASAMRVARRNNIKPILQSRMKRLGLARTR